MNDAKKSVGCWLKIVSSENLVMLRRTKDALRCKVVNPDAESGCPQNQTYSLFRIAQFFFKLQALSKIVEITDHTVSPVREGDALDLPIVGLHIFDVAALFSRVRRAIRLSSQVCVPEALNRFRCERLFPKCSQNLCEVAANGRRHIVA